VSSLARPWLVFVAVAFAMVLVDAADGSNFLGDVDDRLRNLQIARLLETGRWFDPALPMIQTPEVYLSPWSRLVDLPYAALALLFGTVMTPAAALHLAGMVWPVMLLAIFGWFAVSGMQAVAGRSQPMSTTVVGLSAVVMCFAVWEFSPGRTDHHNVQLVVMGMMLAGIARWDRFGAVSCGAGAALSIIVGLECLPFVVVAFGGLALAFVAGFAGAAAFMASAGVGLLTTVIAAGLVFAGPAALASVQCDAFSAPYLLLTAVAALILVAAPTMAGAMVPGGADGRAGVLRRCLVLAVPAIGLVAAVAFLFPSCLAGPYQMIDPVSKSVWLDRVVVEQSALVFFRQGQPGLAAMLAVFAALVLFAVPIAVAELRAGRAAFAVVLVIAASSLVLAAVQIRFIRFPAAFVPLFIPVLAASLADFQQRATQRRVAATLLLPVLPIALAAAGLWLAAPRERAAPDAVDLMAADACADADLAVLSGAEPGRIVAPLGLSSTLLSALPDGFSLAAIPFHRAAPGIRRMALAFTTDEAETRRAALSPFDYVAVCRLDAADVAAGAPLYTALAAGQGWPGLTPVAGTQETRFQLFRIDHAALR
jgi:hypothetical protein